MHQAWALALVPHHVWLAGRCGARRPALSPTQPKTAWPSLIRSRGERHPVVSVPRGRANRPQFARLLARGWARVRSGGYEVLRSRWRPRRNGRKTPRPPTSLSPRPQRSASGAHLRPLCRQAAQWGARPNSGRTLPGRSGRVVMCGAVGCPGTDAAKLHWSRLGSRATTASLSPQISARLRTAL